MKRIIIFATILFLVNVLTAISVSYEQALKIAEHQISVHEKMGYTISEYFEIKDSDEITLAYVFNLQPKGFIATSSDTDIYPVIGYSFLNNFGDLDIPENIGYQYLKNDMKLRLEAIPLTSEDVKQSNRILWSSYLNGTYEQTRDRNNIYPPEGYSSTEGWVETQWDLFEPYNNFCPIDPQTGNRCSDCCVALAQAQILNYHRYIGDVSFDDSDDYISTNTFPYIYIDDDFELYDFPSFPQLNSYLTDLDLLYDSYEDIIDDLVPALTFASCIALEIEFTYPYSLGNDIMISPRIIQKFNYDSASFYYNSANPQFYDLLQADMVAARPACLGLNGPFGGHVIVCDGYNANDDTYHLNMGYGGSWDGWYSLPNGMPCGYVGIQTGIMNIEGGTIPFDVYGVVVADGAPLDETYITLDGSRFHGIFLDDPDGSFDIPILFPGEYEMTAIIELAGGGYYYKNDTVTLDEINNTLIINLDNYETISGTVSAAINPENTHINIYKDDTLVRSGVADVNGDYSIPGALPGDYTATASLNGNYFDIQDVTISANNQIIDFQLEEYPYEVTFNFSGDPVDQLQLFQFMSCAIRLSGEDLIGNEDNIFSQVEFIAPFDPDEGELYAQIWKNDFLFYEQQVDDFTEGEWNDVVFEDLFEIDVTAEYYIGYRIYSLSGNVAVAYHDAGPVVEGNGAYIYTSYWMPLPATYNYNFCIKAVVASQNSTGFQLNETTPIVNYLGNNYPNPFNPTTTISFSLTTELTENTELIIYNLKGQKVKNLPVILSLSKDKGIHTVIWNGTDDSGKTVSSGIYFYKLKAGKFEQIKKMILLK
jgi:peptidase C10-like protein/Spi protease inhibitor/flagellar hook capping protein FlgD